MAAIKNLSLYLVIVTLLAVTAIPTHAGFTEDWLASHTSTGGGSVEGQKRGFMYGGSISARWQSNSDYLVSVQKPKISAGCGGIDIMAGGFNFLGFDYLVSKFQNMLMNAPAILFDVALKALCEQCSGTMKALDQIINTLNGMQFDDCQVAKNVLSDMKITQAVEAGAGKFGSMVDSMEGLDGALKEANTYMGTVNNWFAGSERTISQNGSVPEEDIKRAVSGCSAATKTDLFMSDGSGNYVGGSLIAKLIGGKLSLDTDTVDMFRGLVGDVYVSASGENFKARFIQSCAENSEVDSIEAFKEGKYYVRPADPGTGCSQAAVVLDFKSDASDLIQTIRTKMVNGDSEITADEWNQIARIPYPLVEAIKTGIMTGANDIVEENLREIVAIGLVYGFLADLNDKIAHAIETAETSLIEYGPDAASDPALCQNIFKREVASPLGMIKENALQKIRMFHASYLNKIKDMESTINVMSQERVNRDQVRKQVSQLFRSGATK